MARRPFVAGNWKMNKLRSEAADLVGALIPKVQSVSEVDIAVCPVFTALDVVSERVKGTNVMLGAQNLYTVEKDGKLVMNGAYTGEVSAEMLADAGVQWVILGHSERRQYFGETDASVNAKVRAAWAAGVKTIICVGELLEERKAGKTNEVVETQVRGCLKDLDPDKVKEAVIAYEPVWAIGTGETATPEQAQEVHAMIRGLLKDLFGDAVADAVRIQYGGSMKPGNAKELMAQPDIDGGLIGGAALKADDFFGIIDAAR
ncbi:triose-phosphate isomerase [bacterium]|nr:triose-phosphate isomerase [bacterium]